MITLTLSQPVLIGIAAGLSLLTGALVLLRRKKQPQPTSLFAPKAGFGANLKNLLLGADRDFTTVIPELEELMLVSDVGVQATQDLVQGLIRQKGLRTQQQALEFLKSEIHKLLTPKTEFSFTSSEKPRVIYLVGVNGVGKTTSIGKIAKQFKDAGNKVMLVAADTFRAAAADQLKIWAERNGVDCVSGQPEADPSSVIVDGLRSAKSKGVDVILVDTAGRLQTKQNLMTELQKMVRMCEKELDKNPDEIWLVVDAITGQNGFSQANVFIEAVPLSGIVLTKYDATAKGGIVISIVQKTGLPIRFVGLGEKIEDLKAFDPASFVERMFA